jgi:transcriptional regulator with PAS, ATPase and Fis domain
MTTCIDRSYNPAHHVMPHIHHDLDCAVRSDARVLITGASEVATRVLAELIHRDGQRAAGRFVAISCASMPDELLESRLFGHALGSIHGLDRDPRGLLEQAHGGTIFIADIGAIGHGLQNRLLQFLDHGEIRRVGADAAHARVDVRVIASADRHLFERTEKKAFRDELYYRLNVIHLVIPPRRRQEELA